MKIKEIIGTINADAVHQHLSQLLKIGAPKIIVRRWSDQETNFKAGCFKVKGMNRKYPVANVEVNTVYITSGKAFVWSTQAKGHQANCQIVPTRILKFETDSGVYYYDSVNNQIGKELMELSVQETSLDAFHVLSQFSN